MRCTPWWPVTCRPSLVRGPRLAALGLRPLLSLEMRLGEGSGAALALPIVQSAARLLRDVATFDSAGVSGAKE